MAWLDEHPPARSQFRRPRRAPLSGVIVVHTAENTPDFVAFDGGAEAIARFIQGRSDPGSYHEIVDSDSSIRLVDYDAEAFHDGTGSNPHSLGLSIATRADVWPFAPQAWRDGAIEQAAQKAAGMAAHVKARTGIIVPARRIDRSQSELREPGFISHAERDPARRTDPGRAFPWDQFLGRYAELTREDDMPLTDADQPVIERAVTDVLNGFARRISGPGATYDSLLKGILNAARVAGQDGTDEAAIAAQVLAGIGDTALSDEQVASIVDAMPAAVKQALREGVG